MTGWGHEPRSTALRRATSARRMDAGPTARPAVQAIASSFTLCGEMLLADTTGALFAPGANTLIVSDLHLEKGSAFAERGVFLPPYDTAATLARLARAVIHYAPARVVALGDSFHDGRSLERMSPGDRDALAAIQAGREWVWIAGNHDPLPPAGLAGICVTSLRLGPLVLRHEPLPQTGPGEIAGHLHPVARVASVAGVARRRCFVPDGQRCIMPAFGAFTGGLNFCDEAFAGLLQPQTTVVHAIGRARVYAIPRERCLTD